jgi:hypothetical protein
VLRHILLGRDAQLDEASPLRAESFPERRKFSDFSLEFSIDIRQAQYNPKCYISDGHSSSTSNMISRIAMEASKICVSGYVNDDFA